MTTFQAIQLTCPLCQKPMGHYELTSYFVGSSTVFSDGKVEHDGSFFEDKTLIVCPHCAQVFWRDSAKEEEIQYSEEEEELPFSNSVHDLEFARREDFPKGMINFYNELLEKGFADDRNREIYLRMQLWRTINDLIRYQQPLYKTIDSYVIKSPIRFIKNRISTHSTFKKYHKLHHGNLVRLIELFQPIDENEKVMQAEMYREMGNRKAALQILNELKSQPGKHVAKIRNATIRGRKRVFKLG